MKVLCQMTGLLCRVLDVTKSGYYAWIRRPLPIRQREEERLELEILAAHKRTCQTYGPERLQRDLSDNGVVVGVHRIKRIRRKLGLVRIAERKTNLTWDKIRTQMERLHLIEFFQKMGVFYRPPNRRLNSLTFLNY